MKLLATVLASIVAAFGVIGVFWPEALILVGRAASNPTGLYVVAALRIVFGASLLLTAHTSHAPNALRVIGALVLIAGLLTPAFGHDRASELLRVVSKLDVLWQRFAAVVAVGIGASIVWALSPKAGPPRR